MNEETEVEQSIEDQIFSKTIENLKKSEFFSEKLIDKIKKIDLSDKNSVKAVLSFKEDLEE